MTRTSIASPLALPGFFNPDNAASWDYSPDLRRLFTEAKDFRDQHRIKAASTDTSKIHLLLIDLQRDFCFPQGTLYVGGRSGKGAIDDSRRTAEFIYRNMDVITQITPTMDTHFPFQIFFPSFWVDQNGNPLQPHDMINGEMTILRQGKPAGRASVNPAIAGWPEFKGNYAWLQKQAEYYCKKLVEGGRYMLYIWPEHCILGTAGHSLVGVISEAQMFHAYVRNIQSAAEVKGGNPLTENYSVLAPEVLTRWDNQPMAQKNARFIEKLMKEDAVVIAGQAASHCVKSTIDHLLQEIKSQDPDLARKVYVLEDCTSAVAVPNPAGGFFVDFTPQAEEALKRYADAGMNVVKSTDPIESWPGMDALV